MRGRARCAGGGPRVSAAGPSARSVGPPDSAAAAAAAAAAGPISPRSMGTLWRGGGAAATAAVIAAVAAAATASAGAGSKVRSPPIRRHIPRPSIRTRPVSPIHVRWPSKPRFPHSFAKSCRFYGRGLGDEGRLTRDPVSEAPRRAAAWHPECGLLAARLFTQRRPVGPTDARGAWRAHTYAQQARGWLSRVCSRPDLSPLCAAAAQGWQRIRTSRTFLASSRGRGDGWGFELSCCAAQRAERAQSFGVGESPRCRAAALSICMAFVVL